jgi:hypothetical protein
VQGLFVDLSVERDRDQRYANELGWYGLLRKVVLHVLPHVGLPQWAGWGADNVCDQPAGPIGVLQHDVGLYARIRAEDCSDLPWLDPDPMNLHLVV